MGNGWEKKLSKPEYAVTREMNVSITMRDGVKLAADVYRPDASHSKFPALLAMSPYGKDVQKLNSPIGPLNPVRGNGGQEAGDTEYFVTRGYAHVIVDVRGSGNSEGEFEHYGLKEQQDGYDTVEWIAKQPWCDGNVGMVGMSYFGINQLLIAAQNPPHLKAVVPYEALTDMYRHGEYHGGIYNMGFQLQWWAHVSVGASIPQSLKNNPEKIKEVVRDLMQKEEIQTYVPLYLALKYPEKNPPMFQALTHPFDGPHWWEISSYTKFDEIKIPCYMISRWSGWPIHLAGAFAAYNGINGPKKMMIMETEYPSGPLRPWHDHHDVILRWYDHWLKGNNTGIMDEPPIKLFLKGKDEWRYEHEWPLRRTEWKKYYLRGGEELTEEAPGKVETPDVFQNEPLLLPHKKVPGIKYRTAPLEEDLEVTGPIVLYLYAELDQPDATWCVSINDIERDGSSQLVTKGWLRASHRAIDKKRSKPYQPFHPHTECQAIKNGKIYEYAIDIRETSNVFRKGHRIELLVRGQDSPSEDAIWFHLCNMKETRHTVYHSTEYLSHLLLPVIPNES